MKSEWAWGMERWREVKHPSQPILLVALSNQLGRFTTPQGPKTSAGEVEEMRFVVFRLSLASGRLPSSPRYLTGHRYDGHESSSVLFLVANSEVSNERPHYYYCQTPPREGHVADQNPSQFCQSSPLPRSITITHKTLDRPIICSLPDSRT